MAARDANAKPPPEDAKQHANEVATVLENILNQGVANWDAVEKALMKQHDDGHDKLAKTFQAVAESLHPEEPNTASMYVASGSESETSGSEETETETESEDSGSASGMTSTDDIKLPKKKASVPTTPRKHAPTTPRRTEEKEKQPVAPTPVAPAAAVAPITPAPDATVSQASSPTNKNDLSLVIRKAAAAGAAAVLSASPRAELEEQAKAKTKELQATLEKVMMDLERERQRAKDLNEAVDLAKQRQEQQQTLIAQLQVNLREKESVLRQQELEMQENVAALKRALADQESKLSEKERVSHAEIARLQGLLAAAEEHMKGREGRFQERAQEVQSLQSKLEGKLTELEKEKRELHAQTLVLDQLRAELRMKEEEKDFAVRKLAVLERDLEVARTDDIRQREALTVTKAEIQEHLAQISVLRNQNLVQKAQIETLTQEKSLIMESAEALSRNSELSNQKFVGKMDELLKQMDHKQQKDLSSLHSGLIESLRDRVAQDSDEITKLKQMIHEMNVQRQKRENEFKSQVEQLLEEKRAFDLRHEGMLKEKEALKVDVARHIESLKMLQQQLKDTTAELQRVQEEVRVLRESNAVAQDRLYYYEEEKKALQKTLEAANAARDVALGEKDKLLEDKMRLNSEALDLLTQLNTKFDERINHAVRMAAESAAAAVKTQMDAGSTATAGGEGEYPSAGGTAIAGGRTSTGMKTPLLAPNGEYSDEGRCCGRSSQCVIL